MQPLLAELASRRLLVTTGKGGAGKSVLASALATYYARRGKKVWLVEIGRKRDLHFSRLYEILGVKTLGHAPSTIQMGNASFTASVLHPTESLAEYVDLRIPTAGLAGLFLNNKVTASLLEVVPGLTDLVSIGKVWHSLTVVKNQPDMVIVDGPASGHCVALLHAPQNFERITKQGPLFRDAQAMRVFLGDPALAATLIVSLPEEMSLQESLEHRELLRKDFSLPLLFLNKNFPAPAYVSTKGQNPILQKAYDYSCDRAEREAIARKQFKNKDWPCLEIPFFFPNEKDAPLAQRIADHWEAL